ncbi:MAG: YihY/virulence factor BrkB family protein [Caldilinea sp.]|nr:YihY/virulence factor BrkB family protein [Caldilinea sp.]MDW8439499.1 YihY/virulence factor BrkB family protein [Caldilineaceae bacterium]
MDRLRILGLFVDTFFGWRERRAPVYAAAIAYSTLFSLAPLLLLSMNLASLFLHDVSVESRLVILIEREMGSEIAQLIREILRTRIDFRPNSGAALLSVGFLLFGASGVFRQLRGALNAMWHIAVPPTQLSRSLLRQVRSFLISVVAALLLGMTPIALLFFSAVVASLPLQFLSEFYPVDWLATLVRVLASPILFFALFAIVLRYLPQARAPWRAILPGAAVSAIGYWLGSAILGYYIQNAAIRSIYGAAGSALALLIWAYYSAFIFLYGAKFTYSVAEAYHLPIVPHSGAAFVHFDFEFDS